jgi:hypothetical protein
MTSETEASHYCPNTVIVDSKEYKEFHRELQIDFIIQSANVLVL